MDQHPRVETGDAHHPADARRIEILGEAQPQHLEEALGQQLARLLPDRAGALVAVLGLGGGEADGLVVQRPLAVAPREVVERQAAGDSEQPGGEGIGRVVAVEIGHRRG